MTEIKLVWATPDIDANLAYIARVSNPSNQNNPSIEKLLHYMLSNGHVSPFEMANVCLEINTTRDIARQILRHRSFSFQEFSQRYQSVSELNDFSTKEFRMQDLKNRQASTEVPAENEISIEWKNRQQEIVDLVNKHYSWCLENGGAKEVARVILPEGLTPSKMYMNGTMRSWIFYLQSRLDASTQKEHRLIAEKICKTLFEVAPVTMKAFFGEQNG